ncbi:transglutaminase-like domain-containing protein [Anaerocolumna sp. MB42-C2]|uniref:transglutaminase-like domain-containing protein n=1 Tax=Anaerocolumna sp. MB42-C2 TaxID=3070997 RepID=UPI0027E0C82B|nr:transglutaminase-like domain-containing protein [Anaerocolumna sp. MB42-C2]WMJ85269.1 transglutaminase-like domain-containing protein [Anaerocolumna sp. MB42-C2]
MNENTAVSRRLTVANSFLITLAFGVFLNSIFHLKIYTIFHLFFCITFSGLIYLFDQYKKNLITYFTLCGLFVAGILVSVFFKINYIKGINKVYKWCLIYNGDDKLYERGCALAVCAGILFAGSILTYILHRFKGVKSVTSVLLLVLLIISAVYKMDIPKISVGIVIFYGLTEIAEYYGTLFNRSSNTVNNSIAAIYLAPACLIIALLSVSFPSHAEPIQWRGVKSFVHIMEEKGSLLMTQLQYIIDRTGSEFVLNFSGYSDDENELGGDININKVTALKIKTQNKSTSKGYLIGSISDIYTGRKWEKSETEREYSHEEYYCDFYELLNAFTREKETGRDINNLVKKKSYNVEYYDIRTRSLFYPLKTFQINFNKSVKYSETNQGAFLYDRAKGVGTKYEVQYYELNLSSERLQDILRNAKETDYMVSDYAINKTAKDIFDYNTSGSQFDIIGLKNDLLRRSQEIKKQYTILPANLPDRVRNLAIDLTRGLDNNYDKLKAIEAYLNKFPYNTKVSKRPKGRDFVDYFLFEQKKGYCTYFATTMGVLARCLDIPTRYVEGFVVDYKNLDGSNTYKVLNSSAHSWVEAYIEGIGWIPFEPTPLYYADRYTPWADLTSDSPYHDSGVAIPQITGEPPYNQNLVNENIPGTKALDKGSKNSYLIPVLGVLICILILFVCIILIYYGILVSRYNKRFKSVSDNLKLSLILAEILHYLDKEGFRLTADETLLSYAARIGDKIYFNHTSFLKIVNVYMGVRYGEYEVKTEELKLVMDFLKYFKYHLQEKLGKRRMFFDRFLFLHFYQ